MDVLHVCLTVSDADRLAQWYEEQLDFERTWEFTHGDTHNVYVADGNGVELQLSDTDGETPAHGTAWDHLAVEVDDADAAFDRIDNHGVVTEPMDMPAADSRVAFIEDPDGHVIELVAPLA